MVKKKDTEGSNEPSVSLAEMKKISGNALRFSARVQISSAIKSKKTGFRLSFAVKGLRKGYKIKMGSFCKMGSLFIENRFTFSAKNGFKFNEWVHFYSLQTIKASSLINWNLMKNCTY